MNKKERIQKIRKFIRWMFLILLFLSFIGGYFFLKEFHLEKMTVSGNTRYTAKEIKGFVKQKYVLDNTVLLSWFSKIRPIEGIPFLDKIQISYRNRHEVEVEVYEMAIAGCILDMGNYIYFDHEGMVLESSEARLEGIPVIDGLSFQKFVLHKKLPVKDKEEFQLILLITQLIQENQLDIQKVRFGIGGNLILYHENLTIQLGTKDYLEEKMMNLSEILSKAKGMNGTIHMEDYGLGNSIVTFTPNKSKKNAK